MSDNQDLPEGIKKLRFLDKFIVAFGGAKGINEKMILFDLTDQEKKHITIMPSKGGILDIHETKDDKENAHTPLAKFDLSVFANFKMPNITHEDLVKIGIEEIDLISPEYQNYIAFAPNELFENMTLRKKELLLTTETKLPACKLSQVREHDYRYVLVSEGDTFKFTAMKVSGKYYKLTDESMSKFLELVAPGFIKTLEDSIVASDYEGKYDKK